MSNSRYTSHASYLYVWDGEPEIALFRLFSIHNKPDTVIYSLFNSAGPESQYAVLLNGISRQAKLKVFYSGECIMDETHADVVVGFYPQDKIYQPDSVYLRRNVISGNTESIRTNDVSSQPPRTRMFIQLRSTELEYIIAMFNNLITMPLTPYLTADDIQKIRPYSELNQQWLDTRNQEKTKFACFIVSNGSCKMRNKFFEMLSKSRKVDSLGRFMRNAPVDFILPDRVRDRQEYLRVIGQYKFMITFENASLPYYATEKIYNAVAAGTVPIYWGDPHITEQYNPAVFIHVPTHLTFGDQLSEFIRVIRRLDHLDTHPDEYAAIRNEIPCPDAVRMDIGVQSAVQRISEL